MNNLTYLSNKPCDEEICGLRWIRLSYRSRKALMQLQSVRVAEIENGKLKELNTVFFVKKLFVKKRNIQFVSNKIVSFSVNFN